MNQREKRKERKNTEKELKKKKTEMKGKKYNRIKIVKRKK
jgi:hypothetical protein